MQRSALRSGLLATPLLVLACTSPGPDLPGPRPDGSVLLPNGWSLRPHGKQIALPSDLPIRSAWHPGGRYLAIQHAGYRKHMVAILDATTDTVVTTLSIAKTWSGMAWSPDGATLMVSGGVEDRIHAFGFDASTGQAEKEAQIPVGDADRLDLVAGMTFDADGRLWVCLQRTDRWVRLDGSEAALTIPLPSGSMPFEVVSSRDAGVVYVSLWGAGRVLGFDAATGEQIGDLPAGEHPCAMEISQDGARLFVSNANENTVTVVDLERQRTSETLSSALYPGAPPGSTPNALALDPRGAILLVANADNNNCAVLDVSETGRARGLGFIPLGGYPTSIRFSPDGGRVYATNGKGSAGSRANPAGPTPVPGHSYDLRDYVGGLYDGSLSVFDFPTPRTLQELSERAYACSPLAAGSAVRGAMSRPDDAPIPAEVGGPSPIRHCVYIIKENRTYDQVFGDVAAGNGDPALCLFPEKVTPNHHAIAREWVLLDNFYVESEVSADGHEWTMGAYASDFVERTWPVTYGGRGSTKLANGKTAGLGYPAEGHFAVATPKNGYLFDVAKAAGVSYRSYGEFVHNARQVDAAGRAGLPSLEDHFDPYYRGYDLGYRDVDRARRFLHEIEAFEHRGTFPQLTVLHLPNDHTSGTSIGRPTPRAMVADNDLALGMILEGLSRSRFWKAMVVFVVEDDAQNGPDHVDAHRTVALVAGPWVRRGAHVATMYSTCSMLRTMELILGLPPMSQFDAAARPMYDCFTGTPDFRPYVARPARWPLDQRNEATAWGAELSESFDLSREDAADDLLLNEVIWRSVKGAADPMPAPRRAAFVRAFEEDDEDEPARN